MKRFFYLSVLLLLASCGERMPDAPLLESGTLRVDLPAVPDEQEPVSLTVTGTQSWGAVLVDGDGTEPDWLTLSPAEFVNLSGRPVPSEIRLQATFNPERKLREALIRITTADCTLEIPVVQEKAGAYLLIDEEQSVLTPGPMDTEAPLVFAANDAWTASVEGDWTGISLDKTEGTADDTSLKVLFPAHTWSSHGAETARVVFRYGDGLETEALLSRPKGLTASMTFRVSAADAWSPALTTTLKQKMTGTYTHLASGVPLTFHTAGPSCICMYDNTSLCFDTDGQTVSWIEAACPEDLRIASLQTFCNNTANKYFSVQTSVGADGNGGLVLGANTRLNNAGVTWGSEKTPWTVAPSEGQGVSLYVSKQKNAKITQLEIVYE